MLPSGERKAAPSTRGRITFGGASDFDETVSLWSGRRFHFGASLTGPPFSWKAGQWRQNLASSPSAAHPVQARAPSYAISWRTIRFTNRSIALGANGQSESCAADPTCGRFGSSAITQLLAAGVLTPEAIEQIIHLSQRDELADIRVTVEHEQKEVARRLTQLMGVIENGAGDVASLVGRVRELEMRRRELEQQALRLQPIHRLASEVVENQLEQWRRLVRQSTTTGRAVLQKILRGRLTFTPRVNDVSGEIDGYEFEGETRFDQLFEGITVERPRNLDPNDRTGTENITELDTWEARLNELMIDTREKKVGGMASPAGFEPAFWP
jgi:hypothetical protein